MLKMTFVKTKVFVLVIFGAILYVCTSEQLDSKANKDVIAAQNFASNEISVPCNKDTNPCNNGGTCSDSEGKKKCICIDGTSGHLCGIVEDCENNSTFCGEEKYSSAICAFDVTKNKAVCECNNKNLDFDENTLKCRTPCNKETNPCKNEGTCDEIDGKHVCNCMEGTAGYLCDIVVECENNSTFCGDEKNSGARCVFDQTKKSAVCECNEKVLKFDKHMFKCRRTCDDSENTCKHGGQCEQSENYEFCNCKHGTSGDFCEVIDKCAELKCNIDKSICSFDQKFEAPFCKCKEDNTIYDIEKKDCATINGCVLKMINNECNGDNEYCDASDGACKCKQNYRYSEDGVSCEEDKCAPCPENSDCDPESEDPCKCKDGYFDGEKCVKYGRCAIGISKCSQKCDQKSGKCVCENGFKLSEDKFTCEIINDNLQCNLDCHPGSCVKQNDNETCICPALTHKFNKGKCVDVCTLSKGKPPAGMNCPGKCKSDGDNGILCVCEGLYEDAEDGIHCKRKDMCKEENVINEVIEKSALCKAADNEEGYEIYCDKGFKYDEDKICKRKCDLKQKECTNLNAECELVEKDNDFEAVCRCPLLLTRKDYRSACTEIAKTSFSGEISFLKTKYVIKDESITRHKRSTILYNKMELQKDLEKSAEYVYTRENLIRVNIMYCEEEEEDLFKCRIELQLYTKPKDVNALTSPSYCYNISDNFCLVKNLVVKRKKISVFEQTNPCILKDAFCEDVSTECEDDLKKNTFKCKCKSSFAKTRSIPVLNEGNFVEFCEDIDECKKQIHKCPVNTTCINTYGSYECACDTGFMKKDGKLDPKKHGCKAVCDPNPCENDGECVQKINRESICRCKPMYTGLTCNEPVPVKEGNNCVTIVGSLVGTLLVLIVIIVMIVIIVYRKLKVMRNDDNACTRQRGIRELADVTRVQRNENEYVEINLHANSRHNTPRSIEMEPINRMSRPVIIPRAHVSRHDNADQYLEDGTLTYDLPRRHSDISQEYCKAGSTMLYMNKAYKLEDNKHL